MLAPMSALLPWLENLNALAAGLFLLSAFGMVATRQVLGCLRLFMANGLFLAVSAFLLGAILHSWHVFAIGVIDLVTKPILIPWLLRRIVPSEVYVRREIDQALNIPTSLLIVLALTIAAYFLTLPLLQAGGAQVGLNLPVGMAGLFIGAYTAATRREAVPLLLGLVAMENGAFFAGIAIAPELPLIAELALAFDVLVLVFIIAVLTRTVHEHLGTTEVGALAQLKEGEQG
jgi:hydrogenase-4 component E